MVLQNIEYLIFVSYKRFKITALSVDINTESFWNKRGVIKNILNKTFEKISYS